MKELQSMEEGKTKNKRNKSKKPKNVLLGIRDNGGFEESAE